MYIVINSISNQYKFKKNGLRPLHLRYALEKEYPPQGKTDEDIELQHNIRRMEEFFEDRLKDLYNNYCITKGCIHSREHLNYYLKILGKNHLNAIGKKGQGKF